MNNESGPQPRSAEGSLLPLRVPGREWVVAEAVTIANTTIATMDEQLGAFALGGATPRANRVGLGVVPRRVAVGSRAAHAPFPVTGNDMN